MGDLGLRLYRPVIQLDVESPVFKGFSAGEIDHLFACLGAEQQNFAKGDVLAEAVDEPKVLGVVVKGTALVSIPAGDGDQLSGYLNAGEVYNEDILQSSKDRVQRSVIAATQGSVLKLNMAPILHPDSHTCELRARLIENLSQIQAEKEVQQQAHQETLAEGSLRTRLAYFFTQQATAGKSRKFLVTLTRAQLAEHLGADHKALTRELSQMKTEGLIDFRRSSFRILKDLPTA